MMVIAALQRTAHIAIRADASGSVVVYFTEGTHTTRPRTWINAFIFHAVKVTWAVTVYDALWSAGHIWIAIVVVRTGALCHALVH